MFHLGMVLIYSDRAKEGIDLCIKAADANPHGPINHRYMWHIALGYFALENFSESIEWARRSDQEMPDVAPTLMILASAAAHAGQADKARRTADRLTSLYPDFELGVLRRWPFRDAEVWARFVGGLELAGLDGPQKFVVF
jgi:tetratricopeptide (TPR) repeat protein